jgi:STIP1 family protein 1
LQRLLKFAGDRGNDPAGELASDAEEWRGHTEQLQLLIAEEEARQTREVPDWLCCKITMDVFRDPVITPDGISFEKQVLLDHLAKSQTDPFTRQPLTSADLRPNYALKEACDEFLRANPWAYPNVQAAGLW